MMVLETPRLLLRRLVPGDLDALEALYRDPDVVRYIPDAPRNREQTREELEWFLEGHPKHPELGLWATIEKASGRLVGRCGLLPWTLEGREEVEVAFLLERAMWGRGLGGEVAKGLLEHGFGRLGFERLVCLIEPGNEASVAVAKGMGMTLERKGEDEKGPYWLYSVERPRR